MKLSKVIKKLANIDLWGFDPINQKYVDLKNRALLEVSGHWVSERVSFNSRRVLLTPEKIGSEYKALRFGTSPKTHIMYSEQENFQTNDVFLYDYTVLDETDEAQTVTITTVPASSGMGGDKTETLSDPFPVHMVRFASTSSREVDHIEFSRLYAFAPGNITINEDQELLIGSDRYIITEAVPELLTLRLSITKR